MVIAGDAGEEFDVFLRPVQQGRVACGLLVVARVDGGSLREPIEEAFGACADSERELFCDEKFILRVPRP